MRPPPKDHRLRAKAGGGLEVFKKRAARFFLCCASVALAAYPLEDRAQDRPATVRPETHSSGAKAEHAEGAKPERVEVVGAEERPSGVANEGAKGQVRVWCKLILATNGEKPKAPDANVGRIGKKIEKIFGYKQVEVVGSDSAVDDHFEHWLVPSQEFWLSVRSKREADGEYLLDLRIFHDRRRIIETQAKLGLDSPLLIRGPMCARGQLVIALEILPQAKE